MKLIYLNMDDKSLFGLKKDNIPGISWKKVLLAQGAQG